MEKRPRIKVNRKNLMATTSKNEEKMLIAYTNRQVYRKNINSFENKPLSVILQECMSEEVLTTLKKRGNVKYFSTLCGVRKELTPYEASEYLKGGIKVEIVEGQ